MYAYLLPISGNTSATEFMLNYDKSRELSAGDPREQLFKNKAISINGGIKLNFITNLPQSEATNIIKRRTLTLLTTFHFQRKLEKKLGFNIFL